MAKVDTKAEERPDTERILLKQERVLVLPADADLAAIEGALKEANLPTWFKTKVHEDAWIPIKTVVGQNKVAAIETHTGPPNTADTKPGTFRAPSATAWRGAVRYTRPDKPKVERELLDI